MRLTSGQKKDLCLLVGLGCDRQVAAGYFGCRPAELRAALAGDERFARDLASAEAQAEISHLRCVHQASKDDKHWRASVWWLERRIPERYSRRDARTLTPKQLQVFVTTVAALIAEEVRDAEDRDRLLRRIERLAREEAEAIGVAPPALPPMQSGPAGEQDSELSDEDHGYDND